MIGSTRGNLGLRHLDITIPSMTPTIPDTVRIIPKRRETLVVLTGELSGPLSIS